MGEPNLKLIGNDFSDYKETKGLRSLLYSEWKSNYNVFFSYNGRWRIKTENIELIKNHINHEFIDIKKLKTSRECSEPIEKHPDKNVYVACLRYNSGHCWWNGHISHNRCDKLKESDIADIEGIKKGLEIISPLPFSVDLFHGFEFHLKYNESKWLIGSVCKFPFFLSKTLSWKVASFFAKQSGNRYYQKYLVCRYKNSGSKHICLDSRVPYNDEYEYLSFNESFRFIEKVYQMGFTFWLKFIPIPTIRVYYIMEYVHT
jgi:hypothetical protein